ncbi:hypothetical protein ABW20_dc0103335 [Dactylellina cionopaga]|nr:hypothetical protein ABW20_dc0103335 [Dactylellina cionopaga]
MVDSFDLTWNATAVAFWGILESSLAAIITCLPALNQAMIKFVKRVYHSSQNGEPRTQTGRFGISLFERSHIYRGPAKFISYSADATTTGGGTITMRDYVELDDVNGDRRTRNQSTTPDSDQLQRTANDSYPDITVERSFYVTEERAEDLEQQEAAEEASRNQSTTSLTKPSRARMFIRRPSSPTIPNPSRELPPKF